MTVAVLAVGGAVAASPVLYYTFLVPAMPHGVTFGVASAFIWAWDRLRREPSLNRWILRRWTLRPSDHVSLAGGGFWPAPAWCRRRGSMEENSSTPLASGGRRRRAHRFRPSKHRLETRLRSLDPHSSGPRFSELLVAPLARHACFCRSRLLQLDAPHAGGFRGPLERTPRRPAFVRWLPRDLPRNGLGERQRAPARLGGRRCFRCETVLSRRAPHGARRSHAC